MSKTTPDTPPGAPAKPNAALQWKRLSEDQQDRLLVMPVYRSEDIQKFLKPGSGMDKVAPKALDLLEATPEIAKALKLDVDGLRDSLSQREELAHLEDTAYNLYRRATENRMRLDSEVYAALLKVNRFVQSVGDAGTQRDFSDLSDWISSSHSRGASEPSGAEEEPEQKEPKNTAKDPGSPSA